MPAPQARPIVLPLHPGPACAAPSADGWVADAAEEHLHGRPRVPSGHPGHLKLPVAVTSTSFRAAPRCTNPTMTVATAVTVAADRPPVRTSSARLVSTALLTLAHRHRRWAYRHPGAGQLIHELTIHAGDHSWVIMLRVFDEDSHCLSNHRAPHDAGNPLRGAYCATRRRRKSITRRSFLTVPLLYGSASTLGSHRPAVPPHRSARRSTGPSSCPIGVEVGLPAAPPAPRGPITAPPLNSPAVARAAPHARLPR